MRVSFVFFVLQRCPDSIAKLAHHRSIVWESCFQGQNSEVGAAKWATTHVW